MNWTEVTIKTTTEAVEAISNIINGRKMWRGYDRRP